MARSGRYLPIYRDFKLVNGIPTQDGVALLKLKKKDVGMYRISRSAGVNALRIPITRTMIYLVVVIAKLYGSWCYIPHPCLKVPLHEISRDFLLYRERKGFIRENELIWVQQMRMFCIGGGWWRVSIPILNQVIQVWLGDILCYVRTEKNRLDVLASSLKMWEFVVKLIKKKYFYLCFKTV